MCIIVANDFLSSCTPFEIFQLSYATQPGCLYFIFLVINKNTLGLQNTFSSPENSNKTFWESDLFNIWRRVWCCPILSFTNFWCESGLMKSPAVHGKLIDVGQPRSGNPSCLKWSVTGFNECLDAQNITTSVTWFSIVFKGPHWMITTCKFYTLNISFNTSAVSPLSSFEHA